MIVGVFIINLDGDVLIRKTLASAVRPWSPEMFYAQVKKNNNVNILSPCHKIDKMHYVHIRKSEVYIVTVLETPDISSFLMAESLHRFVKECTDLIGDLTSKNLIEHVAVVYELIIKIFGLCRPDTISTNAVNECKQLGDSGTHEKIFPLIPDNLFGVTPSKENQYIKAGSASKAPLASQQKERAKEIFLDLIEHLTVIIDSKGQMIHTVLTGDISTKSYLSSPVQLQINLGENVVVVTANSKSQSGKINMSSMRFQSTSEAVDGVLQSADFPLIRHLSNPGHSDILSYQIDSNELILPFTMYHNFTKSQKGPMTELTLNCKIFCALPAGISPINWSGALPLPSKLHSLQAVSSLQSMTFSEDEEHRVLTIQTPMFPSQSHHSVSITLLLSDVLPFMRYQLPFLNIQFEIPDLCISNVNIQSLKVHNVATNMTQSVSKWVRRSTHCKNYKFELDDWMK